MTSVLWRCLQWPGHEVAWLDGTSLCGTAVFVMKGDACSLDYEIHCNRAWETKFVSVKGRVGERFIEENIAAKHLAPSLDIDLNFSPSTNTLPIRRLKLAIGERSEVTAAWLRFPSFKLEPLVQAYTRLTADTYRYENLPSGFTAELRVNEEGLVLDYGDIWRAE